MHIIKSKNLPEKKAINFNGSCSVIGNMVLVCFEKS